MTSTMTKAKSSKQISCKVRMLDEQELPFHIDVSSNRSMSQAHLSSQYFDDPRQALSIMTDESRMNLSQQKH